MRRQGLHLRHRVEGTPLVQLDVDVAEGLESRPEAAPRATHSLGNSAHPAVGAGEEGDDAIGLAEALGAQDESFIAVRRHRIILLGVILAGLEAEAAQLARVALPVLGHLDAQVEVDRGPEKGFDATPRCGADFLET